jgi:serine/threonine-protein kinase
MIATRLGIAALCAALAIPTATAQAAEWGAIAYSPSTRATGWSYNHVNEVDAELTALGGCDTHAGDCQSAITFHDACGAVAVGYNGGWGSAWGYDDADAQFKAVDACSQYDDGCEVIRWQCSW